MIRKWPCTVNVQSGESQGSISSTVPCMPASSRTSGLGRGTQCDSHFVGLGPTAGRRRAAGEADAHLKRTKKTLAPLNAGTRGELPIVARAI